MMIVKGSAIASAYINDLGTWLLHQTLEVHSRVNAQVRSVMERPDRLERVLLPAGSDEPARSDIDASDRRSLLGDALFWYSPDGTASAALGLCRGYPAMLKLESIKFPRSTKINPLTTI
jgi:hypothetical protein